MLVGLCCLSRVIPLSITVLPTIAEYSIKLYKVKQNLLYTSVFSVLCVLQYIVNIDMSAGSTLELGSLGKTQFNSPVRCQFVTSLKATRLIRHLRTVKVWRVPFSDLLTLYAIKSKLECDVIITVSKIC